MVKLDFLKKQTKQPPKLKREAKKKPTGPTFLQKYQRYLNRAGIKVPAKTWLTGSIGAGLGIGILVGIFRIDFGILLLIASTDLFIGVPYFIYQKKIAEIEEDLADALKQMSTTFKAGGTFEYALKELSNADYGELSKELQIVLREIQSGGLSLAGSLENFAERVDSVLVKRTVTIMVDASKTGAGLADVFEEIAEDLRGLTALKRERSAKTLMQTLFISSAGGIIGPAIFGIVIGIVSFLIDISISSGIQSAAVIAKAQADRQTLENLMATYIGLSAAATAAMISSMKDGNFSKTIIYFPGLLFVAYLTFTVAKAAMGGLSGGLT